MSLPARAAAIRGDDLQHAIGWYWACHMLRDPDIESVSVEDAGGGSYDDVVVRRRTEVSRYFQAKSSNYGAVLVDEKWLFTAGSSGGRSPLQHFYNTFKELREASESFEVELITTRPFDHEHPFLGKLRDAKHNKVVTGTIADAGPGSAVGKARDGWASHLGATVEELIDFLDTATWNHCHAEPQWLRDTKPLMELAGLLHDDQATRVGAQIVHDWVTNGRGAQDVDAVRAAVAEAKLLAVDGTLVLAVQGIDRDRYPVQPNVTLNFVDLYQGDTSFARKLLHDDADWDRVVLPAFDDAARELNAYRVRHVHILGSLRHPMWFAAGRALPQVKKWTLSADQVMGIWRTDVEPENPQVRELTDERLDQGTDVAVAIGLTADPTADVLAYIRDGGVPVSQLLVLGPEGDPSATAVPSDAWAMGWTRSARDRIRAAVAEAGAARVHMFMLCPSGVALMLGHQWNMLPPTTVYEYAGGTYAPTVTFDGA